MGSTPTRPARTLLEESTWLRRLARSLVTDPAAADEAAQNALVALVGASAAQAASRSWLGTVLRNFLRQERRARSRRSEHEQRQPTPGDEPSALHAVARLELQRRVLDTVLALDEPYRTTITLRFLEELAPREVARRMGVPVKTVHTRVDRGLARMRSRLSQSREDGSTWLAALVPLAIRRDALWPTGLGVLAMSTSMKWVGAGVGLAALGWFLGRDATQGPSPPVSAARSPVEESHLAQAPVGAEHPPALESAGERRRTVRALPDRAAEPATPEARTERFTGSVVDLDGRPVSGIEVRFELTTAQSDDTPPEERVSISDARGQFEMEVYPERGRLVGRGRGYGPAVSPGMAGTMPAEPPLVVVGPDRTYGGVVQDEEGRRLFGVELAVRHDARVAERLVPGTLAGIVPVARTESDPAGEFLLESLGFSAGSLLSAELEGFEILSLELPPDSTPDLVLTLRRMQVQPGSLSGVVLDEEGRPVQGAQVSLGGSTTSSDEDGAFVLGTDTNAGPVLRAVAPGRLPAERSIVGLTAALRFRHTAHWRDGFHDRRRPGGDDRLRPA
jgi:RNA polymerase sigma-70 factor (ECF subfamily)